MKLEPIFNPHARIKQQTKKSKEEERDEMIMATKKQVMEQYMTKKSQPKGKTTQANQSGTGNNFQKESVFELSDKVDAQTLSIKLLKEGYMQAYVDFFYLTNETTPSYITVSEALLKEYQLKKREKKRFEHTEENLKRLRDDLIEGEKQLRDREYKQAFKIYTGVAKQFEGLQDYETASYFYNRCLDISVEYKFLEGEARAYQGLGKAEENVMNKEKAMLHLETSLEKASEDPKLDRLIKEISTNLVQVYMRIASEHQDQ